MERFFQITAVILAGVAAYFLWQGNGDRAFVSAVGGAVSFFLSVRVEVKKRLAQREAEREEAEETRRRAEEHFNSEPLLPETGAQEQFDNGRRTTDKEPTL